VLSLDWIVVEVSQAVERLTLRMEAYDLVTGRAASARWLSSCFLNTCIRIAFRVELLGSPALLLIRKRGRSDKTNKISKPAFRKTQVSRWKIGNCAESRSEKEQVLYRLVLTHDNARRYEPSSDVLDRSLQLLRFCQNSNSVLQRLTLLVCSFHSFDGMRSVD
jgi:hypothetical protein